MLEISTALDYYESLKTKDFEYGNSNLSNMCYGSESNLQGEIVKRMGGTYPRSIFIDSIGEQPIWYHIPNSTESTYKGILTGIADIAIQKAETAETAYIELKIEKKPLTRDQLKFACKCLAQGKIYVVIRNSDTFMEFIEKFLTTDYDELFLILNEGVL